MKIPEWFAREEELDGHSTLTALTHHLIFAPLSQNNHGVGICGASLTQNSRKNKISRASNYLILKVYFYTLNR